MTKPSPGEALKLYLSATDFIVAAVLVKEAETDQRPIYYTSHTLKKKKHSTITSRSSYTP